VGGSYILFAVQMIFYLILSYLTLQFYVESDTLDCTKEVCYTIFNVIPFAA